MKNILMSDLINMMNRMTMNEESPLIESVINEMRIINDNLKEIINAKEKIIQEMRQIIEELKIRLEKEMIEKEAILEEMYRNNQNRNFHED